MEWYQSGGKEFIDTLGWIVAVPFGLFTAWVAWTHRNGDIPRSSR